MTGACSISKLLPPNLLGYFYDNLNIGTMVLYGDKSASCDLVVKVREKAVIEFQMKSGQVKQKCCHGIDEVLINIVV